MDHPAEERRVASAAHSLRPRDALLHDDLALLLLRDDLALLRDDLALLRDGFATRKSKERAVDVLGGLISGRYVLVDQFDAEGRRYLIVKAAPKPNCTPLLSERERQIVVLAAVGYSNKQIGYELALSSGTVAAHLSKAMQKLGVKSRTELVPKLHQRQ